jgi:thioredoxin reductase
MKNNFSYWEQESFLSGFDVLIIGSGIVGLSAALSLKSQKPKLKIGVLEAGFLPAGASTKNAGFACFGSISELIEELKTGREDQVAELIELRWKGLEKLRKNLGDKAILFEQYGGFEVFKGSESDFAKTCIFIVGSFNSCPFIGC